MDTKTEMVPISSSWIVFWTRTKLAVSHRFGTVSRGVHPAGELLVPALWWLHLETGCEFQPFLNELGFFGYNNYII